jgi:hypothetical protein
MVAAIAKAPRKPAVRFMTETLRGGLEVKQCKRLAMVKIDGHIADALSLTVTRGIRATPGTLRADSTMLEATARSTTEDDERGRKPRFRSM